MLHRVWVIGVALALSTQVDAGGIYKCVSSEGTAYQSAPCASGSEEVVTVPTSQPVTTARTDQEDASQVQSTLVANTVVTQPQSTLVAHTAVAPSALVNRDTLQLGISDDQTLNTPGWGPPKKISRHRERAGWREVWTYAAKAGGAPQLEFFNGRLVGISVQPSQPTEAARVVSIAAE